MGTDVQTAERSGHDAEVAQKLEQLRELFADAPEVGKMALETVLQRLASDASAKPPPPVESAGRVGSRIGRASCRERV